MVEKQFGVHRSQKKGVEEELKKGQHFVYFLFL